MPAWAWRLKWLGVFQRGGADTGGQAELGVVGHGQRLVIILDLHHVGHRAEDFLAADAHVRVAVDEQRRRQEVAVGAAGHLLTATGQARALLLADLDVAQVLLQLGLGHHRADVDALLQRRADLDLADALDHRLDETVVDAFGDDDAAGSRAALAGGVEGALGAQLDGDLEVGVVQHDLRVLAAHFQLHLGATRHAGLDDAATDAHRTGEAHGIDLPGVDDGLADLTTAAHHQVEHAGREARPGDDLGDGPGAARHQVGRLDHHAVAEGQRRGDLPGRDGDGEVPGGDQADHAQRLAGDLDADPGADRLQRLASLAQALAGEELEDIAGTGDFADGFRQSLALLAGQQRAELFAAGEDFQADLFQRIGTRLNAEAGPGREGAAGGGDGLLNLGGIGLGVFADHVRQVGGVDVGLVAIRGDPLAVDVVVVALYVSHANCPLVMPGATVRHSGARRSEKAALTARPAVRSAPPGAGTRLASARSAVRGPGRRRSRRCGRRP